jgi:hypothetical protein
LEKKTDNNFNPDGIIEASERRNTRGRGSQRGFGRGYFQGAESEGQSNQ